MQNIVITTDLNLEEEAKVIKSLESKIAELKELKDVYGFAPPQSYAYDDRYVELTNDIKLAKVKRLI